jgi:hypothetical protein
MKIWMRILLVVGLLVIHYIFFFLPLAELFIVYIILFNPRWFRKFLDNMNKCSGEDIETEEDGSAGQPSGSASIEKGIDILSPKEVEVQ